MWLILINVTSSAFPKHKPFYYQFKEKEFFFTLSINFTWIWNCRFISCYRGWQLRWGMRIPHLDVRWKDPTPIVDVDLLRMGNKLTMIMVSLLKIYFTLNLTLWKETTFRWGKQFFLAARIVWMAVLKKEMLLSLLISQQSEKYFVKRKAKTTKDNNVNFIEIRLFTAFLKQTKGDAWRNKYCQVVSCAHIRELYKIEIFFRSTFLIIFSRDSRKS